MQRLNEFNLLTWDGTFNEAPYTLTAVDDAANMAINAASLAISPLVNDVSTLGLDPATFEFVLQDNPGTPAQFDPLSGILTYFPPAGLVLGQVRTLQYRIRDIAGHLSNTADIDITIIDRPFAWRGYGPSLTCETSGGNNTGNAIYGQLEKYYTDDNTPYLPQALKANNIADPDYIAPFQDLAACPMPGQSSDFQLWAFIDAVVNPMPTIVKVTFTIGGVDTEFLLDFDAQDLQPFTFQVAPGAYDSISVDVTNGQGGTLSLNAGTGGSGSGSSAVGPTPATVVFLNPTIGAGANLTLVNN